MKWKMLTINRTHSCVFFFYSCFQIGGGGVFSSERVFKNFSIQRRAFKRKDPFIWSITVCIIAFWIKGKYCSSCSCVCKRSLIYKGTSRKRTWSGCNVFKLLITFEQTKTTLQSKGLWKCLICKKPYIACITPVLSHLK